jgi:stage II sporulation protein D
VKYLFNTILFFLFFAHAIHAQYVRVGIYADYAIQTIEFAHFNSSYTVYADTVKLTKINVNEFISLRRTSDHMIEIKHGVRNLGRFETIQMRSSHDTVGLRLRPRKPMLKNRKYQGGFDVFNGDKGLTIVNVVSMNDYISGVVESEGGGGKHIEYYKAQAVLSRSYALKHKNKHKNDGYHLCDRVHCQAYHKMLTYTPLIRKAVLETEYEVVMDSSETELLQGYFHANCGGQTSASSYVWNKDIAYLTPFVDTFCIHTRQAHWEKRIKKDEWRNYLVNTFHFPINDTIYANHLYSFHQPYRKAFLFSPHLGIPLRDIRIHFKLKSTFFDIHPEGDYIILKGRGYGHGVGLCQEGAMNMARKGLNYAQIIKFYFQGAIIKNFLEELYFDQNFRFE